MKKEKALGPPAIEIPWQLSHALANSHVHISIKFLVRYSSSSDKRRYVPPSVCHTFRVSCAHNVMCERNGRGCGDRVVETWACRAPINFCPLAEWLISSRYNHL